MDDTPRSPDVRLLYAQNEDFLQGNTSELADKDAVIQHIHRQIGLLTFYQESILVTKLVSAVLGLILSALTLFIAYSSIEPFAMILYGVNPLTFIDLFIIIIVLYFVFGALKLFYLTYKVPINYKAFIETHYAALVSTKQTYIAHVIQVSPIGGSFQYRFISSNGKKIEAWYYPQSGWSPVSKGDPITVLYLSDKLHTPL